MKRNIAFAIIALSLGCGGLQQTSDTAPVEAPPEEPSANQASEVSETEPEEPGNELEYHWRDGRTRAYLPPTSSICQEDEMASPSYAVASLHHYLSDAGEWSVVDVNSSGRWRISCNAMLDLIDVFGFDLKPGVYAIEASLDGLPEYEVFTVGSEQCEGSAAPAEAGTVAACVSGSIKMIPAPPDWK